MGDYLVSDQDLTGRIRVTPDGKMVSVTDVIKVVCFTDADGNPTPNARQHSTTYYERLCSDHEDVNTLCVRYKFSGRGQRETPVAGRKGVLQIIQLLRGKKAAKYRERTAELVERYMDADMGLADDITDRALATHMADIESRKASAANDDAAGSGELHKRIESRDTTKVMCQAIKEAGVAPRYYGLMNGGVNQAITGMPTKDYRTVQVNLRPREAAREAFTDSMLHMSGTINCVVRDNLAEGSDVDAELAFMKDKCAQAARLLGLHEKAKVVQPREHVVGNKRVMAAALACDKRARIAQPQPVALLAPLPVRAV